jgi:hypothetical protein
MSSELLGDNIENINLTLKNIFSKDYECDPSIQETLLSIKNGLKIYPNFRKRLEEIANMINDIINKVQYVYGKLEEYNISLDIHGSSQIEFFDNYRAFCSQLKRLVRKLSLEKDIDPEEVDKYFIGLLSVKKTFDKKYTEILGLVGELETDYTQLTTPSYKKNFWSITKWIYQYKFILYISGILLYNTYYYSFGNDVDSLVDVMVKICGSVCYSFMSDPVLKTKLLSKVSSIVTFIIYTIYTWLPMSSVISYFLSRFPNSFKKIFNVSRTILFYIFVNFAMEWVSYIIQVICQSIIIFGEGFSGRLPDYTSVLWTKFENIKQSFFQSYESAVMYIQKNVIKNIDVLVRGVVQFFIKVVYEDSLKPIFNNIKSSIFSVPQNILQSFRSVLSSETTESSNELSLVEIQNMIDSRKEYATSLVEKFSDIKIEGKEMLINTLEHFKETEELIKQSSSEVYQNIQEKFKENLVKSGSLKLWNDIKKYKFDKVNMINILFIMFLFELIKIIFN